MVSASLTLLQILNFLINIRRISFVFYDLILNQLEFMKKFTQLSASLSHNIEQIFGNDALISHSSIPDYAPDLLGNPFSPQFSDSGCRFEVVPVRENFLFPYLGKSFFLLNLLFELFLQLQLLLLLLLSILPPVLFNQLIRSSLFLFCFWW